MTHNKNNIRLWLLLGAVSYGGYVGAEPNEEPDYSETQWRTFYGEKPVEYRPEYWTTYYTNRDDPNCQAPGKVYIADGWSPVARKIHKEFIAEESNGGKNYMIRYPNKFKLGNCIYSTGGGRLYIEEKSDDPRLTQEPYTDKTQIFRSSIVRNGDVATISLEHDSALNTQSKSRMYLNKPNYNVFCHKVNNESLNYENLLLKRVYCSSSSIENGVKKYMKFDAYTISFWRAHPDIEFNFKVSNKIYCYSGYCQKTHLPVFDESVQEPEKFAELYQKGDK